MIYRRILICINKQLGFQLIIIYMNVRIVYSDLYVELVIGWVEVFKNNQANF